MGEVEFIQVELPVEIYEKKIRDLVELLLKIDEEALKGQIGQEDLEVKAA